jgi:RHS repeat-associated protein
MTTVPKPSDPTQSYTATYDAWNRLIRMEAGADKVAEYEYDGAKRRTLQKTYTAGVLSETRHLYYTEPSKWQVIEERTGTSPDSADAERRFVWGLRYIDDLVLRDRDTDANGSLDERLYALQDANWNVTAITNSSGTVQERYAYTAYGVPIFLDATFGSRASSSYAWETLYAGYRWDAAIRHFQVRHRVYNATVGTWLTRDPLKTAATLHLYEYCNSRPIRASDPFGLRGIFTHAECDERWTWCRAAASEGYMACMIAAMTEAEEIRCGDQYVDAIDHCDSWRDRCHEEAFPEPEFCRVRVPVPRPFRIPPWVFAAVGAAAIIACMLFPPCVAALSGALAGGASAAVIIAIISSASEA